MADQNQTAPTPTTPVATPPAEDLAKELEDAAQITKNKIHQDPAAAQNLATDPAMQDEVVDIEKALLNEIVTRLNKNEMSQEDAQKLAKEFLSLLPIQDKKDLLEKLNKLSQTYAAASGIYLKYAKVEEDNDKKQKLELMSKHIQDGNIEHAINVAKGVTNE